MIKVPLPKQNKNKSTYFWNTNPYSYFWKASSKWKCPSKDSYNSKAINKAWDTLIDITLYWNPWNIIFDLVLALGYGRKWRLRKKGEVRTTWKAHWLRMGWSGQRSRKEGVKKGKDSYWKRIPRKTDHKMDRGQLNKRKNPPIDALEHLVGKKEEHASEALKTWVKWT